MSHANKLVSEVTISWRAIVDTNIGISLLILQTRLPMLDFSNVDFVSLSGYNLELFKSIFDCLLNLTEKYRHTK